MTITCAQATIVSMTRYLHQRFDYNRIRILDINNAFSTGKTKAFPSTGLIATQMIEIFNYYGIPIGYEILETENEEDYKKLKEYIDYSIESGLPILLALAIKEQNIAKRHVVQIIGHPASGRNAYVVYDDSGALLKHMDLEGFVAVVPWKNLKKYLLEKSAFVIYPIHEKVYILYKDLKKILQLYFQGIPELQELENNHITDLDKTRFLLVDNRELKDFLRQNFLSNLETEEIVRAEIERLIVINMPHYIWYCEVPLNNGEYLLFIADPTYGKITSKNIFYNSFAIKTNKQLGLLGT